MHREMLLSAASKLHHNALWTQSPSPAPFEPAVQVRSPDSRLDSFHMAKLELEASAMENHRASSLVTRAALKDAMRVLDENRALKQLQAQTEGRLMVSEQEGQALREMLAADRASMRSLQAALQSKITALELEVARLVNSRECLREEVVMLRRHCYLIISTSPSNHSRPNGQHTQSAERASAGAFEGDSREAGGAHGELSRSQVAPAQAAMLCTAYGIENAAELEAILSAHQGTPGFGLVAAQDGKACANGEHITNRRATQGEMGGEVYSVKGIVERVSWGMPWLKSSASPMVLPLDSAPPIISRMPSAEDIGSRALEPSEVELSDDSDSDLETPGASSSAASPTAASFNLLGQRSLSSDSGGDETPLSTSATIREMVVDGSGVDASKPLKKPLLGIESSVAVMWGCAAEKEAATVGDEALVSTTTPSGGLDLKRGKPSAVRSPTTPGSGSAAAVHVQRWRQVCLNVVVLIMLHRCRSHDAMLTIFLDVFFRTAAFARQL